MTARSALAFLDWLLDHDAQLSRLQTSKATLEASPACLDRGSSFVEALFCDVPIHDLVGARLRSPSNDEGASAPLKLTYFDFHGGRGEPARIALSMGGIPFEDERVKGTDWERRKPSTPFGALPLLEKDGEILA